MQGPTATQDRGRAAVKMTMMNEVCGMNESGVGRVDNKEKKHRLLILAIKRSRLKCSWKHS